MSNTLVIKHLPHTFSEDEKINLLKHFGAQDVKILSSKRRKYSLAFATFPSNPEAEIALKKLHQLDVKGSKLNVEFAKDRLPEPPRPNKKETDSDKKSHLNDFINSLNAFNNSVNFMQPPPPHLKYKYPVPNKATLSNIMHALSSNSKFYTQVCHLMNRMNLPPPFSTVPDYLVEQSYVPQPTQVINQNAVNPVDEKPESSEEESEIESDPEDHKFKQDSVIVESKPKKTHVPLKRTNVTKNIEYTPKPKQAKIATEEVFEKVDIANKKIEVKVSSDAISKVATNQQTLDVEIGTFGKIYPPEYVPESKTQEETEENTQIDNTSTDYISSKKLAENRLSESNYSTLPAFKNYNPGPPSCRLYIKNLAKTVTLEDLHFIYRRYLIPDYQNGEETLLIYDVKLMQEGRMKGQAFITLQNETQAALARKETNGYILKDKPMVVVFARSAKAT